MFGKGTSILRVYKNAETQQWIIYDYDENNNFTLIGDSDFGMIVLHILNQIKRINTDGTCEFKKLNGETFHITLPETHRGEWEMHYDELMEIILNKHQYSKFELYQFFLRYRFFGYAIINNYPLECCWDFYERNTFNMPDYIHYNGVFVSQKEEAVYERYSLLGFESLFLLDLSELLLTDEIRLRIRKCENCGDFYRTGRGNTKYCEWCREPQVYNRHKNQKQNEDEIKQLKKRIYNRLYHRPDAAYSQFLGEFEYYMSVIKGNPTTKLEGYRDDIHTLDDLYQWLLEIDKSTLKRPRKEKTNGTTPETS